MANTKKRATVRKTSRTSAKNIKVSAKTEKFPKGVKIAQNWLEDLKLSESYVSLLLGAVVVLVLSAVFFMFIRGGALNDSSEILNTNPVSNETTLQNPRTYTLKEGEGLWDIAVKYYGDGYKWVDIAKANNLTEQQANHLGPGSKIIVPDAK